MSSRATSVDVPDGPRLQAGDVLVGRFQVKRFIAQGGMGEVYEATDGLLKTRVALKVIRGLSAAPGALERFRREVLLARRVSHPNVCRVYELYEGATPAGTPLHFLTMELLEGESLASRLAREGRLSTGEALPLVRQMAEGLAAAHTEGVIHRDFKSSNVMLVPAPPGEKQTASLRVAITDFGIARALDAASEENEPDPLTSPAGILGTPEYMAPEQVTGAEVTAAADIYALGVVLYEMVTGKLPFSATTPLAAAARRLEERPPRPDASVPGLDRRWADAIVRCLARAPERRFLSARDVISAIERPTRTGLKRAALVATLLALVVGSYAVPRYVPRPRFRPAAPAGYRPAVAILGIADGSHAPERDWVPVALSELLTYELQAAESSLRAVSGERVRRQRESLGLSEEAVLDSSARRRLQDLLAADVFVYGSLVLAESGQHGGAVRVRLQVEDAASGKPRVALEEDLGSQGGRLPEASARLGDRLRAALGASLTAPEETALLASRVSKPEAAKMYAQGVLALGKSDQVRGQGLLQAAISSDSGFLQAPLRLAWSWASQGYRKKALEIGRAIRARPDWLAPQQAAALDNANLYWAAEEKQFYEAELARFSSSPDDVDLGVRLVGANTDHIAPRTRLELVRRIRELPGPAANDIRLDDAEALALSFVGEFGRAKHLLEQQLARARKIGARSIQIQALETLGEILWISEGKPGEAVAPIREARVVAGQSRWRMLAWVLLVTGGSSKEVQENLDELLALYRRFGNRRGISDALAWSGDCFLQLGDLDRARRRVQEARLEEKALGESREGTAVGDAYSKAELEGWIFAAEADAAGLRSAIQLLKSNPSPGEVAPLALEGMLLYQQDHLRDARETWLRAATIHKGTGNFFWSLAPAKLGCAVHCEEGSPDEGLQCLDEHRQPPSPKWDVMRSRFEVAKAACRYRGKDLAGAGRDVAEALAHPEASEDFELRVTGNILLLRIAAAQGERMKALADLRELLRETERRQTKALSFEVALALGETELEMSRPEGRTRLRRLQQEARAREFFRIARLAGEALQRHPAPRG